MRKFIIAAVLTAFGASIVAPVALAHSGGTDKNGCHMNHKTGIRHCH